MTIDSIKKLSTPLFYAYIFGKVNIFSYISSMKITKDILIAIEKRAVRKEMKDAGFFDGRFRSKRYKDKKKEANKKHCRKKIKL